MDLIIIITGKVCIRASFVIPAHCWYNTHSPAGRNRYEIGTSKGVPVPVPQKGPADTNQDSKYSVNAEPGSPVPWYKFVREFFT